MGRANSGDDLAYRLLLKEFEALRADIKKMDKKLDDLLQSNAKLKLRRSYFVRTISCLRVEKQALLKYARELEGFLKVQREGDSL